jgi:urease accessory protein
VDPARIALRDVGRHGRLDLTFECRRGRTVLAHAYAEPPLRVGSTFDADGAAYLILVCYGPGIFAGDTLRQSVHVKPGARVVLVSQSALQIHPGASGAPARIDHEYRVDDGGELHCDWDPVIPFAAARLDQRFDLQIAGDARLYWSDAIMSGRATRGERWQFDVLSHELCLRVDGRLDYLERYRLAPGDRQPARLWVAGDSDYFSTTLVRDRRANRDHSDVLQRSLDGEECVTAGVDLVADCLLAARLLSSSGVAFAAARRAARSFACASIFERPDLADRK